MTLRNTLDDFFNPTVTVRVQSWTPEGKSQNYEYQTLQSELTPISFIGTCYFRFMALADLVTKEGREAKRKELATYGLDKLS